MSISDVGPVGGLLKADRDTDALGDRAGGDAFAALADGCEAEHGFAADLQSIEHAIDLRRQSRLYAIDVNVAVAIDEHIYGDASV
jgi:hypothetical protein